MNCDLWSRFPSTFIVLTIPSRKRYLLVYSPGSAHQTCGVSGQYLFGRNGKHDARRIGVDAADTGAIGDGRQYCTRRARPLVPNSGSPINSFRSAARRVTLMPSVLLRFGA